MPRRPHFLFAGIFSALVLAGGVASADPSPGDRAAARVLFDDARKLMQQGSFANACPKLEESQRIDPGMGTQFNLAECQEKVGRLASASENFLEVANNAKNAGQHAREAVARGRAAAIAPKIGKLVVTVERAADGLVLKRDGVEIRKPLWGLAMPVDPGGHEIVASAPGRLPFRKTVTIPAGPRTVNFAVPALAVAPPDAVTEAPVDGGVKAKASSGQRIAGVVMIGAGVVGLGAGGILGLVAKGKANDSNKLCDPNDSSSCTPAGASQRADARSLGNLATAVFIGGGAIAGIGAVVFLTAPSANKKATTGVFLGPDSVSLRGTF